MAVRNVGTPGNDEDMAQFFNTRAGGYEEHMQANIEGFEAFYRGIADALPQFDGHPHILDLGIGTGLELERLFERYPDALVTGIDLSKGMLAELIRKRPEWRDNLTLIQGSFLNLDLGTDAYDAVISSMALHHWIPDVKRNLYCRIRAALRAGGTFINADYTADATESQRRLAAYAARKVAARHQLHIDLPLEPEVELKLLADAGFIRTNIAFENPNACIFVASNT